MANADLYETCQLLFSQLSCCAGSIPASWSSMRALCTFLAIDNILTGVSRQLWVLGGQIDRWLCTLIDKAARVDRLHVVVDDAQAHYHRLGLAWQACKTFIFNRMTWEVLSDSLILHSGHDNKYCSCNGTILSGCWPEAVCPAQVYYHQVGPRWVAWLSLIYLETIWRVRVLVDPVAVTASALSKGLLKLVATYLDIACVSQALYRPNGWAWQAWTPFISPKTFWQVCTTALVP